jgi:hypothetical protein
MRLFAVDLLSGYDLNFMDLEAFPRVRVSPDPNEKPVPSQNHNLVSN